MSNQLKTVMFLGLLSMLLVGIGGAAAPGMMHFFLFLSWSTFNFSSYLIVSVNKVEFNHRKITIKKDIWIGLID